MNQFLIIVAILSIIVIVTISIIYLKPSKKKPTDCASYTICNGQTICHDPCPNGSSYDCDLGRCNICGDGEIYDDYCGKCVKKCGDGEYLSCDKGCVEICDSDEIYSGMRCQGDNTGIGPRCCKSGDRYLQGSCQRISGEIRCGKFCDLRCNKDNTEDCVSGKCLCKDGWNGEFCDVQGCGLGVPNKGGGCDCFAWMPKIDQNCIDFVKIKNIPDFLANIDPFWRNFSNNGNTWNWDYLYLLFVDKQNGDSEAISLSPINKTSNFTSDDFMKNGLVPYTLNCTAFCFSRNSKVMVRSKSNPNIYYTVSWTDTSDYKGYPPSSTAINCFVNIGYLNGKVEDVHDELDGTPNILLLGPPLPIDGRYNN